MTPNNLVHIYSPDSRDGSFLKLSQPFPKVRGVGWNRDYWSHFLSGSSDFFPFAILRSIGIK